MEGKSGGRAASPAFSFHRAVRVKDGQSSVCPPSSPGEGGVLSPQFASTNWSTGLTSTIRRPQADHHILHRIRHTVKAGVRGNGILRVVPEEQIDHILHDLPQPRGGHRKQE